MRGLEGEGRTVFGDQILGDAAGAEAGNIIRLAFHDAPGRG